jgi:uncharacterized membrane protein
VTEKNTSRADALKETARFAISVNPLETLYDYERWAIRILLVVMLLFGIGIAGHTLDVENPLSEAVYTYFLDSILNESSGDSGYNYVNTASYGIGLALFVVSLSGLLRVAGIDGSDAMLIALLPWVLWAPLGEVIEDAGLFSNSFAPWFVSPGVHFQTAAWVVLAGLIGHRVSNGTIETEAEKNAATRHFSAFLIAAQASIYGMSVLSSDNVEILSEAYDREVMLIIAMFGVTAPYWLAGSYVERFDHIQRTVYSTGVGGSIVLFGMLAGFAIGRETSEMTAWPIVVVFGVPILVCYVLYSFGKDDAEESLNLGYIPGVLPPGVTESEYLESKTPLGEKVDELRKKAVLASPAVFLPVGGQIGDGIATWIGIDYFGYTEKHVISSMVTDFLDTSLTFTLLKVGIAGVICWFYSQAVFEHRQQHLRVLIALCLMVVGMAPALRNVFRLTLGV